MTEKRMTDERLAEIEHLNSLGGPGVVRELLQALKAERNDNTVLRRVNKNHLERISELEDANTNSQEISSKLTQRISELEQMLIDAGHCPKCNELWVAGYSAGKRLSARCPDCGWKEALADD